MLLSESTPSTLNFANSYTASLLIYTANAMPLIHLFNPGHETAILLGKSNYTPPVNVRIMQEDLACLPLWYADATDYVFVPEATAITTFLKENCFTIPMAQPIDRIQLRRQATQLPELTASPWGLCLPALCLFRQLEKETHAPIRVPEWNDSFVYLTGRKSAADCLDRLHTYLPQYSLPATPCFCQSLEEVENYLQRHKAPFVIKTPFSSSGRGVQWIHSQNLSPMDTQWIQGALNKQKMVSIEPGLCNQQDFAMEFYADGQGHVRYEGLSIFQTEKGSAYSGNRLQRQADMQQMLTNHVPQEVLTEIQKAVEQVLTEQYGPLYQGYIGVDMLIYQSADQHYAIHPCVEINMRYTMGMVALQLFRRLLEPTVEGRFHIVYHKQKGDAYEKHLLSQQAHPLQLSSSGRLVRGYLSLCPVTPDTHYRAYVLV